MIDTETDALVEAMARAAYESTVRGLRNCWEWDSPGLDTEHPGARLRFEKIARALLPLITAHTAAAVAAALRAIAAQMPDGD